MSAHDQAYIRFRGRTTGPYAMAEVQRMIRRGQVTSMHEISTDQAVWQRIGERRELLASPTPPAPAAPALRSVPASAAAPAQPPASASTEAAASPGYEIQASSAPAVPAPPPNEWYYALGERQVGPVPDRVLRQLATEGRLDPGTLVWREGMADWCALSQTGLIPAPQPAALTHPPMASETGPHRAAAADRDLYAEVPWIRRAWVNRLFLVLGLFLCAPLTFISCVVVLTGDVYENAYDHRGRLKQWGTTSKVIVMILSGLSALALLAVLNL